jgi:CHAD domain-containing protein
MERVMVEADKARADFAADPVHDLRVAIRRCRSMAEGFRAIDPDPSWNKMRRAAKGLFAALGELRDTQVLMEWVGKLSPHADPVSGKLLAYCGEREQLLKAAAAEALRGFDFRQWLRWTATLERRALRFARHQQLFEVLALENWEQARRLHSRALRNRSQIAWHQLRIGIKRFRYLVENFLPRQHEQWSKDLKTIQDLLGEVHDLDVLWATARSPQLRAFSNAEEQARWKALIFAEREKRLGRYRQTMIGRNSLWQRWRDGLPQGQALRRAVLKRFRLLIPLLCPDRRHTEHVLRLSLELHAGLRASGVAIASEYDGISAAELLTLAALTHGVRRAAPTPARKRAWRFLRGLEPPPGWTEEDVRVARLIGRFHRGALPGSQKSYARLPASARAVVDAQAGILRLADRLDEKHDQSIRAVRVERGDGFLIVRAAGYRELTRPAEHIAAARHLLESVCGMPLLLRPLN